MGVVRGEHKAPGDGPVQALPVLAAGEGHPLQHIPQEGGVRALAGQAANLLVVKEGQHRDVLPVLPGQEGLGGGEHALQIVQAGGGDELLLPAEHRALGPAVQVQIPGEDVLRGNAGVLGHHGFQIGLAAAQQGQGVLLGVQLHALVDAPVHVDGHPGDEQQIPADVAEDGLHALLGAHSQPPRHRQGPVGPQCQLHAAVDLRVQLGVLAIHPHLGGLLHLKAGGIPMGGHHGKGAEITLGHLESHEGTHAPDGEVLAAGLQLPGVCLQQLGKALLKQHGPHRGHGVAGGGGALDKVKQLMNQWKNLLTGSDTISGLEYYSTNRPSGR